VGRGCSSQFLTDDQHMHLGLGTHTKPSEVGTYLPADFDKLEYYVCKGRIAFIWGRCLRFI
ncbi:hypothetical protein TELCIR_02752, partial [Teladorsagia circumcincta]